MLGVWCSGFFFKRYIQFMYCINVELVSYGQSGFPVGKNLQDDLTTPRGGYHYIVMLFLTYPQANTEAVAG